MTSILRNATNQQLEQAAADNHRALFAMNAIAQGGEVKETDGLTWTYNGPGQQSMIAFPLLTAENAGEKLDEMMAYYRNHIPKNAGCWSLLPPHPSDLGIRLLARGFQPGWKPNWMALDLEKININYSLPPGVEIKADNHTSTGDITNLPYAGESGAVSEALLQSQPELTRRFIARMDGKIVGHSCVLLSESVGGIYNVGVLPRYRNQNIGKAVVIATCLYAKEKGYQYVILNGTGRRMYEQIGFKHISDGITWWLMNDKYVTDPPSPQKIALAEAVGKGDIKKLTDLLTQVTIDDLNTPLTNDMTLLQLAAHYHHSQTAQWLVDHGTNYRVLDAWDLRWKDRAAALLAKQPALVNELYEEGKITLLHKAAERNDIELAKLALSAKPDLEIKDKIYDATALGWAEHLSRNEIASLIKQTVL